MVAVAGYLPVTLSGTDYLELLPVTWRAVNEYGIRIAHRTYDSPDLGPLRRQPSGVDTRRNLWVVHYDPYDLSHVFLRDRAGWLTIPWTHLPMVAAPFADFTWRHARQLAAERGLDPRDETDVARVLDDLLTRAGAGPGDKSTRVAARTRAARPAPRPPLPAGKTAGPAVVEPVDIEGVGFGLFDADAEAARWP